VTSAWLRLIFGNPSRVLLSAGCCLLLSCNAATEADRTGAASHPLSILTTGERQPGNDARAWLSGSGGASDTNFCAARLKLPLDPDPAWGWEYTDGSFSPFSVSSITHYKGRLYVTAYSQQLACLDALTGAEYYKPYLKPIVQDKDESPLGNRRSGSNDRIMFGGQFLHPAGKLLLLTGLGGQKLLFDISADSPMCIWQAADQGQSAGFLLADDAICAGNEEQMEALEFDGTRRWEQLTQGVPVANALSASGVLCSRNEGRNIWANRLTDGALLWSLTDASDITGMNIDDGHDCIYVTYFDERVDALSLQDGSLLWSYDFSWLLDAQRRSEMLQSANSRLGLNEQNGFSQAVMDEVSMVVQPEGVVLAISFGMLVSLDAAGQPRWIREGLMPISSALGFDNGILLEHYWYPLELASQYLAGLHTGLPLKDQPNWERVALNEERLSEKTVEQLELRSLDDTKQQQEFQQQMSSRMRLEEPLQILYGRYAVYDNADGSELAGVELPQWASRVLCPALDKVVVDDSGYQFGYYMHISPGGNRTVHAYNWLEPGGAS
jgi:outer membrane protein assembly factor BamB